ncbi:Uncharacterised protein [Mycobacteroides abscessus subsp. abscessus]|nr:Uncharacterised protein [Mycobacteroides abscessus subsp. abscessus]
MTTYSQASTGSVVVSDDSRSIRQRILVWIPSSEPSQPMSSPPKVSRQPCSQPVPAIGECGARCNICSGCMLEP